MKLPAAVAVHLLTYCTITFERDDKQEGKETNTKINSQIKFQADQECENQQTA